VLVDGLMVSVGSTNFGPRSFRKLIERLASMLGPML
jgi:phosphatidylserine/phosphatidylglycerophosphate/cardiolipin synthase-like enzyme